ncbi:hypothetical protein MSHO_03720 [Mycobacterium shottsii]|uniref:UspA domain-containing protein n=1 Tax=Mycobacterium shottsii TaxID=133549 RepID=A0A7I7L5X0_9MYCO|nr:hypothetical protein MSHO_03720 [Mycobacterium shottsii]
MGGEVVDPGIVIGIDGSPGSDAALKWAVQEATMRNVALTVVHAAAYVPDAAPKAEWFGDPAPDELLQQLDTRAQQVLADAVQIVKDATDDHRLRIIHELSSQSPVPALVELSRKADLVVVGSRGQGLVKRMLLGSVSTGLVHHAHCPVAVVPSEVPPPVEGPVVVGIDGSPAS